MAFMASRMEDEAPKEKLVKYEAASEEIRKGLDQSHTAEWEKYVRFGAGIPIMGAELTELLQQGRQPIPSNWVETDKNEHLKVCHEGEEQTCWMRKF